MAAEVSREDGAVVVNEEQLEEIEALQYIYGDDASVEEGEAGERKVEVIVNAASPLVRICLRLGPDYPSASSPRECLVRSVAVSRSNLTILNQAVEALVQENKGSVVIYVVVEMVREKLLEMGLCTPPEDEEQGDPQQQQQQQQEEEQELENGSDAAAQGEGDEGSRRGEADEKDQTLGWHQQPQQSPADGTGVFANGSDDLIPIEMFKHGKPFTDRKSTFQAHLVAVTNERQVELALESLLTNNKVSRATHNIMAYRCFDPERGIQLFDNDDDGESAAGGRLAEIMALMQVNNVMVVVSRWFGGIHLGPDRFKHINNVARSLLEECGFVKPGKESSKSRKKAK